MFRRRPAKAALLLDAKIVKARGKSKPGLPAWRPPAGRLEPEFSFLISFPKSVRLRRAVAQRLGAGGLPKVSSRSNCATGNTGCVVHADSERRGWRTADVCRLRLFRILESGRDGRDDEFAEQTDTHVYFGLAFIARGVFLGPGFIRGR